MHPLDPISLSHHMTAFLLLLWLFEYLTVRPVSNSGSKTNVTLLSTRFEKTTMESTSQILIIYIWLQTLDELFLSTSQVLLGCGVMLLAWGDVTCWEPMSTKVLMFDCKSTNAQEDGNLQTTKCKCHCTDFSHELLTCTRNRNTVVFIIHVFLSLSSNIK